MRHLPNALLLLALSAMVSSCEKDTVGDGLTCDDLTGNMMIVDGKAFTIYSEGLNGCAVTGLSSGPQRYYLGAFTHGEGDGLIMPTMRINLSSLPPAGQTTTYVLDSGIPWQYEPPIVDGRATITVNNYQETMGVFDRYNSLSQAGTVEVTSDASGNISFSFSVMLTREYNNVGNPDDYQKRFCASALVCGEF